MQGLKEKKVEKNQLEDYEKELKKKMKEVENAVQIAFQELYKNGKFKKEDGNNKSAIKDPKSPSKIKNSSIKGNSSSL